MNREGIDSTIVNYCVAGAGWCDLSGRRFAVKRGDVMVVPAGTPHAYGSDDANPWSIYWFHAMGDHVPALLGELSVSRAEPVARVGHHAELVALFVELDSILAHDYSRPSLLYAAQLLAHLWGVMTQQHRRASQCGDNVALRVRRTLEHMRQKFARPLRVEDLAAMAGLSTSTFAERFRELTGSSPKSYLTRLRLRRAAELLARGHDSVASIARQVGYDDALYFSRAFRRVYDACPSAYRAARPRPAAM